MPWTPPVGGAALTLAGDYSPPVGGAAPHLGGVESSETRTVTVRAVTRTRRRVGVAGPGGCGAVRGILRPDGAVPAALRDGTDTG